MSGTPGTSSCFMSMASLSLWKIQVTAALRLASFLPFWELPFFIPFQRSFVRYLLSPCSVPGVVLYSLHPASLPVSGWYPPGSPLGRDKRLLQNMGSVRVRRAPRCPLIFADGGVLLKSLSLSPDFGISSQALGPP